MFFNVQRHQWEKIEDISGNLERVYRISSFDKGHEIEEWNNSNLVPSPNLVLK